MNPAERIRELIDFPLMRCRPMSPAEVRALYGRQAWRLAHTSAHTVVARRTFLPIERRAA